MASNEDFEVVESPLAYRPQLISFINSYKLDEFVELAENMSPQELSRIKNEQGQTLLHRAIIINNKDAFDYMLEKLDPSDLNTENNAGQTPLMLAVKTDSSQSLKIYDYYACELIKKGADLTKRFPNGDTLLHVAVIKSCKIAQLLLREGMDVNAKNNAGKTVLHTTLMRGTQCAFLQEMVTELLSFGADPSVKYNGKTCFELAMRFYLPLAIQKQLLYYTFDDLPSETLYGELMNLATTD